MRIRSVQIRNFRCLEDISLDFDDVTTFVGSNGVGKSSILRALDWFFNATTTLDESDLRVGAAERKVEVRVDFDGLTAADRIKLGKYAIPGVDSFTAWKTWTDGDQRMTGKALAFAPLEAIRAISGSRPKQAAYKTLREEHPEYDLPVWATSEAAMFEAWEAWENVHPTLLTEATVSATDFFGFYSNGKLSGLFDFVFISADLRANEESEDGRSRIIGRILEKTIDRTGADAAFEQLAAAMTEQHASISSDHFGKQLAELSSAITQSVSNFSIGRQVSVTTSKAEFKKTAPRFEVGIRHGDVVTDVGRQGHGFQRSLLIAALKLLAERGAAETGGVICLCIEEPELFQHPVQARAFSSVLRSLAEDRAQGVQVVYATHSPLFVEPRKFNQLRRISRVSPSAGVEVHAATEDEVVARLDGYLPEEKVRRQLDGICLNRLAEAMFAEAAILVEGVCDVGVLQGVAERTAPLGVVSVATVSVGGKSNIPLALAVLLQLGVRCVVTFDADSGVRQRMLASGSSEKEADAAATQATKDNRGILAFMGIPEQDWPEGSIGASTYAFQDRLEELLAAEWAGWAKSRDQVVTEGRGFPGKDSETYRLASREAEGDPPSLLLEILATATDQAL